MEIEFTTEEKEKLEYLLSLEKASRVVGKSYEDIVRTYNHSMEDGEQAVKFRKFQLLHAKIMLEIEHFLNEHTEKF